MPATPAVEPEPQDVLVLAAYLGVVPVHVGLLGSEQVQVPLAGGAVRVGRPGPGAALEAGHPVGGDLRAVRALARVEPEPVTLGRPGPGRQRCLEPDVLVGDVVGDDVHDRADAQRGRLGDEGLSLPDGAERGVDRPVVGDVVAAVRERGRIPRGEPERVDAEVLQVAQVCTNSREIAGAVAVPVGKGARVDLVDHRVAPPLGRLPQWPGRVRAHVRTPSSPGCAGWRCAVVVRRWRDRIYSTVRAQESNSAVT